METKNVQLPASVDGVSMRRLWESAWEPDPRIAEGVIRFLEGDTRFASVWQEAQVSADFPYILGTNIWRTLLGAYQTAEFNNWRSFCNIVSLRDFRQNRAVRLSYGGTLPKVIENEPFNEDTLSESKEDYTLETYGKIFSITRQMIVNDDLRAFQRIPMIQGVAAARTVAASVFGVLANNPTMDDGNALFSSAHGNLGSTALNATSLQAGITAMERQTDSDGTQLGLRPRYLIVPPELKFTAMQLLNSAILSYGGATSGPYPTYNAITDEQLELVVSPLLTDTNNWYLAADPRVVDTIHVGFLNGQTEPDLMTEAPNSGGNFTADRYRYKVRIDYVAKAVDWRGLYGAIVT